MGILNFDNTTQQQTQCVSKGGLGQNHLCKVHTATSNLRQTILFKSQVLKGITLPGRVQHCNSKANLGLAKKWSKTLENLAELSYYLELK